MPSEPHQDTQHVREFFDQWQIYQKVVEANYMFHREAYAAIGRVLDAIRSPISFLDLGAGDARWTSRLLDGREVTRYEAVDLSEYALGLARKNTAGLHCAKRFTQGDFVASLPRESNDIVFIGMSLHHLPLEDKRCFLPRIREIVSPGGAFIFYEVIRRADETRKEVLDRWWDMVSRDWSKMTSQELAKIKDHVFSSDYQESIEGYLALAEGGGFSCPEVVYQDPGGFFAAFRCGAG